MYVIILFLHCYISFCISTAKHTRLWISTR
ncbi:hypothetical protein CJF30_00003540 [Rutstroemia sp. NJR-2017a BBW]|nr:hypothetical protein CJF30_00003540 [Rutstroemia sp. NJR-2017a BBW]